jgi:hypothetical protein
VKTKYLSDNNQEDKQTEKKKEEEEKEEDEEDEEEDEKENQKDQHQEDEQEEEEEEEKGEEKEEEEEEQEDNFNIPITRNKLGDNDVDQGFELEDEIETFNYVRLVKVILSGAIPIIVEGDDADDSYTD